MKISFKPQDIGYLLTAYADGQLAPDGVMWVEEQLDHNADLRAKLKEVRHLQASLRSAFAGAAREFVLDLPRRESLLASAANPPSKRIAFMPALRVVMAASLVVLVLGSLSVSVLRNIHSVTPTASNALAHLHEVEPPPMKATSLDAPAEQFFARDERAIKALAETDGRNAENGVRFYEGVAVDHLATGNRPQQPTPPGQNFAKAPAAPTRPHGQTKPTAAPMPTAAALSPASPPPADELARSDRLAVTRQLESEGKKEANVALNPGFRTGDANESTPAKPAVSLARAESDRGGRESTNERRASVARAPVARAPADPFALPPSPQDAAAKTVSGGIAYGQQGVGHEDLSSTAHVTEALAKVDKKSQDPFRSKLADEKAKNDRGRPQGGEKELDGKDKGAEPFPVVVNEVNEIVVAADAPLPISALDVPLEEQTTLEDDRVAEQIKGREEAVATGETGSTGAFMAIGAGGNKNSAMSEAQKELIRLRRERHVYLRQLPADDLLTQPVQDVDSAILAAETRLLEERLELTQQSNNEKTHIAQGSKAEAFQLNAKLADVEDDFNNNRTSGQAQRQEVKKSYRIVDLSRQMRSFPGPDLDIPEPNGVGGRTLPPIEPDTGAGVNELIEIIQKVVAPSTWGKAGTSIEVYNGQLVVTNTADVQRQVDEFLATLRAQSSMRGLTQATDVVASMTFLRSDMTANLSESLDSAFGNLGGGMVVFKVTTAAESLLSRKGNVSMRDEPVARGIVRLARSAGLQVRLHGGSVEVDVAQRPISPEDAQGLDLKSFKDLFGTSPMQVIAVDAIQTIAIDADTASYEYAKSRVAAGQPIDPTTIKPEHFINAMPMDYPAAQGPEAFTLFAEAAPSPFARAGTSWGARTAVVSIGAVAKPAAADERKPLALTLAIDCSGSMAQAGGLDRIQRGLLAFVEHLRAEDRVSIVAFGDQARVILPATPGNDRAALTNALVNLATGGATNAAEGLGLAYQLAAETAAVGVESRVLLATDGGTVAGADELLRRVTAFKDRGITLVVVGTGQTYRAGPLQDLATKGDGQHFYVGSDDAAEELFTGKLLPDRLAVLAKDAKLQVTWNPQRVSHARLIGYDQRRLATKDFRDNTVDAGELSQDTQVTALFEVLLVDGGAGPLGTAAVRYKDMRREQVRELACPLPGTILQSQPSERLRLLACAAATAEWLQRGWWSNVHLITPQEIAAQLARCPQPIANELRAMVK